MKTFLCLLSLAGLLIASGCAVEGPGYGGYYGPTEFSVGVGHPYYHRGYWDRGHYYRY